MVRKVIAFCVAIVLCCAIGTTVLATTHEVYDGSLSNTYVQYFRDIISDIGIREHYVAFRSGQYSYTLVVGVLSYNESTIHLETGETAKEYTIATDNGYNNTLTYTTKEITEFSLTPNDRLIYSDMGNYPQLIDRGQKYEILTTILLGTCMLSVVINRIFFSRKR